MALFEGSAGGRRILKIGLWWHIIGCGPLYLTILLQTVGIVSEKANPIGFGLLALISFLPSIITMIVGGVMMRRERRN